MLKENTRRNILVILALLVIGGLALLGECGCGNASTVKPDTRLETSLENQQEMQEKMTELNGTLTKIQQNISMIITTITQKFETFQESISNKIGEVGRDVNTKTNKTQNSSLYGIGVVGVALLFALACLWFTAKAFEKAAVRFIR